MNTQHPIYKIQKTNQKTLLNSKTSILNQHKFMNLDIIVILIHKTYVTFDHLIIHLDLKMKLQFYLFKLLLNMSRIKSNVQFWVAVMMIHEMLLRLDPKYICLQEFNSLYLCG